MAKDEVFHKKVYHGPSYFPPVFPSSLDLAQLDPELK